MNNDYKTKGVLRMIVYKTDFESINWDMLIQLYYEVDGVIGLAKNQNKARIKKSFLSSYKVVTAWEDDKIVGAGRMISDGYCYAWIHDIGVLPDYQKRGIGRGVMEELMNEDEEILFERTSSLSAEDF